MLHKTSTLIKFERKDASDNAFRSEAKEAHPKGTLS
jgi:hypothetical protein